VRGRLDRVGEDMIARALADGWEIRSAALAYLPVGGGAYHWIARTADGGRWFVTCDDLDIKPWLGNDRDSVFDGLLAAYAAAIDLRAAGLSFVAAPIASITGAPAERVDERHSVSVCVYVSGETGAWGRPYGSRGELVTMLARLHRATPPVSGLVHRRLEVPARERFEEALGDLDHRWDGGPLSELARRELVAHLDMITGWLAELDRFAAGATANGAVVTHGEPHPGNLIRTRSGTVLVDWDTVALAPPERDLWMITDPGGTVASAYCDLTGVALDAAALAAHRLLWALSDVAAFTAQLRDEQAGWHSAGADAGADADRALAALRSILDGHEPSPYGTRWSTT
jgi:spectinomycin phosphotransferase